MIVNVCFKPKSWEHEEETSRTLNRIAGKSSSASGYCFADGSRDLDYSFRDPAKAKAFIRAAKRIRGVHAEIVN